MKCNYKSIEVLKHEIYILLTLTFTNKKELKNKIKKDGIKYSIQMNEVNNLINQLLIRKLKINA